MSDRDFGADLRLCRRIPQGPWIPSGLGFQVMTSDGQRALYEIGPVGRGDVDEQRRLAEFVSQAAMGWPAAIAELLTLRTRIATLEAAMESAIASLQLAKDPSCDQCAWAELAEEELDKALHGGKDETRKSLACFGEYDRQEEECRACSARALCETSREECGPKKEDRP